MAYRPINSEPQSLMQPTRESQPPALVCSEPDEQAQAQGIRACAVFFLDVVGYSKRPVSEQQSIKQALNTDIRLAMHGFPREDFVALDTGDGIAITFLSDIEQAFKVTLKLKEYLRAIPPRRPVFEVRIGINLGPVKLVQDINGQANVIGDGINVAQRIMSFAAPGRVLVSSSYYEMMSRLQPRYAQAFLIAGQKLDKHAREHSVFELCVNQASGQLPVARSATKSHGDGTHRYRIDLRGSKKAKSITTVLLLSAVGIFGIFNRADHAAPPRALVEPAADVARTGVIKFAIAPWGQIFVDGQVQGASPPITQIRLSSGRHRIEIRNARLKPHVEDVQVIPNQSATIRHRFAQG